MSLPSNELPLSCIPMLDQIKAGIPKLGPEVDNQFVSKGFLTIAALIARDEVLCGKGSHDFLRIYQFDKELRDSAVSAERAAYKKYGELEKLHGFPLPQSMVQAIWLEPQLTAFVKQVLLRRYCQNELDEKFAPHRAAIVAATAEEQKALSKCWGDKELVRFFTRDSVPLRKEVVNTVLADALGPLGFVKRASKQGVDSYQKQLGSKHVIVFEEDPINLEYFGWDKGVDYGASSYSALKLDTRVYVTTTSKGPAQQLFSHVNQCLAYACTTYRHYFDTRSLEVALRAQVLLYEMFVAPHESEFEAG